LDRETLLQIIENEIKTETTIYSDQRRAFSVLNHNGYIHQTDNHLAFFIDPETGAHTQQIKGLWKIIKSKYNIIKNGVSFLLDR
jgi:transposase-like protein